MTTAFLEHHWVQGSCLRQHKLWRSLGERTLARALPWLHWAGLCFLRSSKYNSSLCLKKQTKKPSSSCPWAFLLILRYSRLKTKRQKRTGDNNLSPGLLCWAQLCCPSHNTWRKCHTNRGSRIRAEKDLVTALLRSQHWCLWKIKPGKRPRVPTPYCCCLGFNLYVWTMYIFHWFRWGAMNIFIRAETVTGLLMFTVTG